MEVLFSQLDKPEQTATPGLSLLEPPLPGLDLSTALDRIGGNLALLRKIIGIFCRTEAETPQRLRQALADGDEESSSRLAHTLKSTAGTVGAIRLQEVALAIEQIVRHQGTPDQALLAELDAAHAEALQALACFESRCSETLG